MGALPKGDASIPMIRVLVVDDVEEWRNFICDLLLEDERFEIVGKPSDGLQAIQLAVEAKPTVVLLDIQMPKLNGLETARRILAVQPQVRIIFVTGEGDHDIVVTAFEIGASGYVLKAHAGKSLIVAIDEALRGNKFTSHNTLPPWPLERERIDQERHSEALHTAKKRPPRFSFANSWS
jgi:two-component system response regulator NreC